MDRKDKIKNFVNDPEMSRAVHGVLLRIFLKTPANKDVQTLAARWMAKDLLEEGWREFEKYKVDSETEKKELGNIGV